MSDRMIMRANEVDSDGLKAVLMELADYMAADCAACIDGDRICPVCGSIITDGVCSDPDCRWTTE
jgi:hypothetical protein